eukprot:SAG31_NODE_2705_length_5215_cov_9.452502_3_plen_152_part_00
MAPVASGTRKMNSRHDSLAVCAPAKVSERLLNRGDEFSSSIPSMELFDGEATAMAIESNVITADPSFVHSGYPTLGFYENGAAHLYALYLHNRVIILPSCGLNLGDTIIFNCGCTDWAFGLSCDLAVQGITRNVLERLGDITIRRTAAAHF